MVTTTTTSTNSTTVATRSPARIWLTILGVVLVLTAILGMVTAAVDFFHGYTFHIEAGEMVLHWVLAILTLGLAFGLKDEAALATTTIVYGCIYLLVGILGFFVGDDANPIMTWHVGTGDNLLHLALGVITVAAGLASRRPSLATRGYETETRTEQVGMTRRR